MTNPRELVERLAEELFLRFWRRNGHEPEGLDGQAEAIKLMWRSIAADAIEARDAEITRLRGLLEAWEGLAGRDRINLVGKNGDSLDEIVLTGMAHLEKMTSGSWYLGLYRPDGSGYQVWLSAAKGAMRADYAELDAREEPEKQDATSTTSGQ